MKLTNRARVWAALCWASRTGEVAPDAKIYVRDREDVDRLLDRLAACGLAERVEGGVQLTEKGCEAARRTLASGRVPDVVMHDATAWRQRAWQSMRIHRRFTAAQIAATCDGPSVPAVQRYCRELVDLAVLRSDGGREIRYTLARDIGPDAPRKSSAPGAKETDPTRPWRRRVWTSCRRLGQDGSGIRAIEVAVASGVSQDGAHRLLEELTNVGALVRCTREGGPPGGRRWVYSLTPNADDLATPVVTRQHWRERAWDHLLRATTPVTTHELADVAGVVPRTARILLDGLERAGYATSSPVRQSDTRGSDPLGYQLVPSPPAACPPVPHYPQYGPLTAQPEVSDA
ncbi:MAG: FaeA/PapI family transcriptional regulator [Bacteroidota bacterium]